MAATIADLVRTFYAECWNKWNDSAIDGVLDVSFTSRGSQGRRITEDFRYTDIESISVVLFRTAMGVTEVDEVRDVLRLWAGSLSSPRSTMQSRETSF